MSIEVKLDGNRDYLYHLSSYASLPAFMEVAGLRTGRCLLVTDSHVGPLYADSLISILARAGWEPYLITVQSGEKAKRLEILADLFDQALAWGIDRKTPVLALGGGVVGDLAGYAAASLLRGLPLVQLPTTLIAQVDSAIGGKTGINHARGKNLIGAFHQPALVCADLKTIQSLPEREWTSGLAEVVKHALIADEAFLSFLESNWSAILVRAPDIIEPLIRRAAEIKVEVVMQDEKEAGLRAILNFGHTFGHAIEQVAGYGHYTHGEAVALGMRAALLLSQMLHPTLDADRAERLVRQIPIGAEPIALPVDALVSATKTDKKALGDTVRFVLLKRVGSAYVENEAPPEGVREAFLHVISAT